MAIKRGHFELADGTSCTNVAIKRGHFELADGTSCNNVAIKRGTVKITLIDNVGKFHDSILHNTLYIPTTRQGACISFHPIVPNL